MQLSLNSLRGPKSNDQYTNIKFMKSGGMGSIYSGIDNLTGEKVAIKLIRVSNPDDEKLLQAEFDIAKSLDHSNIIKTFYSDLISSNLEYFFYSVMEYAPNGSLRDLIENQAKHFELSACLEYMNQIAEGLSHAHSKIIHRDLKPENILVADKKELKICDFGIAKYVDELTRTRTFKGWGTFPYMAPECWMFDKNDVRMDIYSLGIIYYEMLTLNIPFSGKDEREFRDKHLFEPLPDLSSFRADIPTHIVQLVSKMTEKRAHDRYQSMDSVRKGLSEIKKNLNTNNALVENVLQKAHKKISKLKQEDLEKQKNSEEERSQHKLLQFSLDKLFDQLKRVTGQLNASLEQQKLVFHRQEAEYGRLNDSGSIYFIGRKILISFFPAGSVKSYIENFKKNSIERQKQIYYGMIVVPVPDLFLEKDGVLLVGKAQLDSNHEFGFNLVLRRIDQDDIYGEWWICLFEDNPLSSRGQIMKGYPLNQNDFFQYFEHGRSNAVSARNMSFKKLEDTDIIALLEKLVE